MKDYFKRFIVLKRLSGQENCTLKIEGEKGFSTVYGELFTNSFKTDKYAICYSSNKEVKVHKLLRPCFEVQVDGDLSREFSALVLNDNIPILYGGYGDCLSESDILLSIKDGEPKTLNYDDDVIATENYYEVESEKESVYITADRGSCQNENSPPKEKKEGGTTLYENTDCCERQNYYDSVKDKLIELINTYERDYTLCSLIPNSDFVKINYDQDKFYSVGKVLENNEVKFICYAVLGNYQGAPNELKDYCKFLPLSPFDSLGKGYYVIFQSATNGEIIS